MWQDTYINKPVSKQHFHGVYETSTSSSCLWQPAFSHISNWPRPHQAYAKSFLRSLLGEMIVYKQILLLYRFTKSIEIITHQRQNSNQYAFEIPHNHSDRRIPAIFQVLFGQQRMWRPGTLEGCPDLLSRREGRHGGSGYDTWLSKISETEVLLADKGSHTYAGKSF